MWDPLLGWVKCNWMIFGVVLDNILITLGKKKYTLIRNIFTHSPMSALIFFFLMIFKKVIEKFFFRKKSNFFFEF